MKKQLEILSLSDEVEKKVKDWREVSYTLNKQRVDMFSEAFRAGLFDLKMSIEWSDELLNSITHSTSCLNSMLGKYDGKASSQCEMIKFLCQQKTEIEKQLVSILNEYAVMFETTIKKIEKEQEG